MQHILIRYGELTLKGQNKNNFVSTLILNIKNKLLEHKEKIVYKKDFNSLTLEILDNKIIDFVISNLKNIFGIYSISIVDIVEKNILKISENIIKRLSNVKNKTIKIEVERKDKSFLPNSMELKKIISSNVLKALNNLKFKVDLHNPEIQINIVIKKDGAYIFNERIKCKGGLPVGVSGKGLSMLSGGIDSPVSSYLTLKRGMQIHYLHFITPPHTTNKSLDKTKQLVRILRKFNYTNANLYICDFSDFLNELVHAKEENYRIILMRRAFIRIANLLGIEINANALITGESLGQVASQTIESINVINNASELPILRPLITFDKDEIIKIAKDINTYETSILPYDDACSLFVPTRPITKPRLEIIEKIEKSILFENFIDITYKKKISAYYINDKGEWNERERK